MWLNNNVARFLKTMMVLCVTLPTQDAIEPYEHAERQGFSPALDAADVVLLSGASMGNTM